MVRNTSPLYFIGFSLMRVGENGQRGEKMEQANGCAKVPDYLYNPEMCPCPRGAKGICPRFRSCDECRAFHATLESTPYTSCEVKAREEGYSLTHGSV